MTTDNAQNDFQDIPSPPSGPHHLPGQNFDTPSLTEDVRNLYTLAYAQLISSLSDVMFPRRTEKSKSGALFHLVASDARVDRYIWFRSAWQPNEFGQPLQLALRDLTAACLARYPGRHFSLLEPIEANDILNLLQSEKIPSGEWTSSQSQSETFSVIHEAIREGLFAEPGYGGNRNGIGWYYSNLMEIPS